jgi:hypothetical protein
VGLCVCNKLFRERFARPPTGGCSMCTGELESVRHVLGECADVDDVAARKQWAERIYMQEVLRKVREWVGSPGGSGPLAHVGMDGGKWR